MKDPLLSLPGYSLRRAAAAMMAEFAARLEPVGLRIADVSALLVIGANARITASQLGRMLDIQRANMVPLVARLEDAGLIERTPLDGKSHSLGLTEAGEAKLTDARRVISDFENWLIGKVPAEHRDHLVPALDALWRN
ncbi:MarR family winged helix-turn-helix transcriptional regulator [Novosphingobium sp.]|uniref:MarR family winged helix-turn-helix transcriptional regulator n=1 Tax=Novosphingobium sp. TaxID=1874826 RepID=UPI0035B189C2